MATTAPLTVEGSFGLRHPPDVEIVVPVHDEEAGLEASVRRLAAELDGVRAVHRDEKGRGRALRATWSVSDARVVTYMDVDLSTDLDALLPLVAPLLSGHSDVAIGSRLAQGARVVRGPKHAVAGLDDRHPRPLRAAAPVGLGAGARSGGWANVLTAV